MPVPEFLREPLTMYEVAEQYWDLKFIPTQYVFSLLALKSEDKLEREKCIELSSPEGQEEWLNYCRRPRRTIIEVLRDFHKSTSKLTLEVLFELFSTIKPREFSIASSCLHTNGQSLDLLVAVVQYYSKLKEPRLGLCSNWLKSLKGGDRLFGWLKSGTLSFPADNKTTCILIGPGTGMAPFRSYIQERVALENATKDSVLFFFGCRYREKDFHCGREMEFLEEKGVLTFVCAFSRDQENKIYVQHKINEQSFKLWPLISERKAQIYISGNAKNMPDNVKDAFVDMAVKIGGLTDGDGRRLVKDMEESGRLQIETW